MSKKVSRKQRAGMGRRGSTALVAAVMILLIAAAMIVYKSSTTTKELPRQLTVDDMYAITRGQWEEKDHVLACPDGTTVFLPKEIFEYYEVWGGYGYAKAYYDTKALGLDAFTADVQAMDPSIDAEYVKSVWEEYSDYDAAEMFIHINTFYSDDAQRVAFNKEGPGHALSACYILQHQKELEQDFTVTQIQILSDFLGIVFGVRSEEDYELLLGSPTVTIENGAHWLAERWDLNTYPLSCEIWNFLFWSQENQLLYDNSTNFPESIPCTDWAE